MWYTVELLYICIVDVRVCYNSAWSISMCSVNQFGEIYYIYISNRKCNFCFLGSVYQLLVLCRAVKPMFRLSTLMIRFTSDFDPMGICIRGR